MNAADLREDLAPRVAAKLIARAHGLARDEAELLAHEIIAMVQAAALAAQAGIQPGGAGSGPAGAGAA